MSGERIEALLNESVRCADPATMARVEELVEQLVEPLRLRPHSRHVALLRDANALTEPLRRSLGDDPLLSALLTLHGLHPDESWSSASSRRSSGYARTSPRTPAASCSSGSTTSVWRTCAWKGSCDGCGSSAATVRELIERAIQEAAPEMVRVDVEATVAAKVESAQRLVQLRRAP